MTFTLGFILGIVACVLTDIANVCAREAQRTIRQEQREQGERMLRDLDEGLF